MALGHKAGYGFGWCDASDPMGMVTGAGVGDRDGDNAE